MDVFEGLGAKEMDRRHQKYAARVGAIKLEALGSLLWVV